MTAWPSALDRWGFVAWLLGVAVITLTPTGAAEPFSWEAFACFDCARRFGADLLLNGLLFVPAGFALRGRLGTLSTVLVALALTLGIESVQVVLPGRHPTLADLVMNTLGAAVGAGLRVAGWRQATFATLAGLAVAAWLSPPLLLRPRPTTATLYAQWTPRLGHLAHYDGRVLDARVDGEVTTFRLDDSERVRRALARRAPVDVVFEVGAPPTSVAPVYALHDANQQENLLVGVTGPDLVARTRTVARSVGLDQPDLRWDGALADALPGDTVLLRLYTRGGERCVSVGVRSRCDLTPGPGDGYAFLYNLPALGGAPRLLLSLAWSGGLGLVLGLAWRRPAGALLAGAGVAVAGGLLAAWSPDMTPRMLHMAALMGGAGAGWVLRRWGDRVGGVAPAGGGEGAGVSGRPTPRR